MKKLVLLSLIAVASTGFAADCGCFEFGAEALYWKPAVGSFRFAEIVPQPIPPNGTDNRTILAVDPDYDWGFRIYADYFNPDCCYHIQLGWTRLRTNDSAEVRPETGVGSLVTSGNSVALFARGRIKTDYDKVNLRGGYSYQLGSCFGLGLYVGARYVNLERFVRQETTASIGRGFAFSEETHTFKGGGLEFGLAGDFDLPCNFSFGARLGGIAVIGRSRGVRRFQSLVSIAQTVFNRLEPATFVRPAVELRFELAYTYCCDCFGLKAYVGYELDYYFSVLHPISLGQNDDQFGIGFGGPLLGLSVQF